MILRPRRRLRQLERKLADVELVVYSLPIQLARGGKREPPRVLMRHTLLKLAEATIFLDDTDEIIRGACSVRLERRIRP